MASESPDADFRHTLWHRKNKAHPWRLVAVADSFSDAVARIGTVKGSGEWLLLPKGKSPDPHRWEVPKTLPPPAGQRPSPPERA